MLDELDTLRPGPDTDRTPTPDTDADTDADTEAEPDTETGHPAEVFAPAPDPGPDSANTWTGHPEPEPEFAPAPAEVSATEVESDADSATATTEHLDRTADTGGADTPNTLIGHDTGSEHMSVAVADTANEREADTYATPAGQSAPVPELPDPMPLPREAVAPPDRETPPGAVAFYIVSVMSLLVSLDTSWLFFGKHLHIENLWVRGGMFAVLEAALIACGIGMAAGVRRHQTPGSAQVTAWALCGLSGYMAVVSSGPIDGLARVMLGPVLGMVMFHHALGIEKKARTERSGVWARIGREFRERMLSRLGLADDERDAARRTRDRAARRVAKLSLGRRVMFREARVAKALSAAGVAQDETMRSVMLAELATRRHAGALADLVQASPWTEHLDRTPDTEGADTPDTGTGHRTGVANTRA